MAGLSLRNIYKKYPGGVTAVTDFTLEIEDKEFIILVGPSGCGKSTTLRMIAGLEEISEGELFIGDKLVNDVPPKDDIKRRVEEAARILDISHLLDRKPKALSGGQRQRVALGRAIVREPKVFLLDEPLSNLDAKLRAQMRTELNKLHKRLGTTFIYVTHDQVEAMTMGDRIVVMKDGFIQQVDTPQNLYDDPVNVFVAGFIGSPQMNFVDAKLASKDGKLVVEYGDAEKPFTVELPDAKAKVPGIADYVGKEITLGVRPEDLHTEEIFLGAATTGLFECKVDVTEMMGAETHLYLDCAGNSLTARVSTRVTAQAGEQIKMAMDVNKIHLFDKETERAIF